MRSQEAVTFSDIADTTANFELTGGRYAVCVIAAISGDGVQLQFLGPDGSTFIPAGDIVADSPSYVLMDLPPGQYQLSLDGTTDLFASIVRVPLE